MSIKEITDVYLPWQTAFNFYNEELFDGQLPPVFFSIQRKRGAAGYYAQERMEDRTSDAKLDELAMNPDTFAGKSTERILSTLVHEMCHHWQRHFGLQKITKAYHNREFAAKMEEVGLMCSATGEPGGKTTGRSMSHYILEWGAFEVVTKRLMKTGFKLGFEDRWAKVNGPSGGTTGGDGENGKKGPKSKRARVVYHCQCVNSIAGKPGLSITCNNCGAEFVPK